MPCPPGWPARFPAPGARRRDRVEPRDQVILRQLTQDPFHQERGGRIEVHAPQVEQRIEVDVGDAFREQLLRHREVQGLGAGSLVGQPDEGGDPRLWSQLVQELRRGVAIQDVAPAGSNRSNDSTVPTPRLPVRLGKATQSAAGDIPRGPTANQADDAARPTVVVGAARACPTAIRPNRPPGRRGIRPVEIRACPTAIRPNQPLTTPMSRSSSGICCPAVSGATRREGRPQLRSTKTFLTSV